MINDAPGPIDFVTFLMLFEEKLRGMDPRNVLKNAFGNFDENNEGVIDAEQLRELLVTTGDKLTDKEVGLNLVLIMYVIHTCRPVLATLKR